MVNPPPGLALLRALVPDTDARRAFVVRACSSNTWQESDLVHTSVVHGSGRHPSAAECQKVRSWIESI